MSPLHKSPGRTEEEPKTKRPHHWRPREQDRSPPPASGVTRSREKAAPRLERPGDQEKSEMVLEDTA